MKLLKQHHDDMQKRPNQYVVEIRKTSDGSFYGYHVSTFCQVSDDIFNAKRYAGLECDKQLRTIHDNIFSTIGMTEEKVKEKGDASPFAQLILNMKNDYWSGMKPEDFYLDAVYLDNDMPRQTFRYKIV